MYGARLTAGVGMAAGGMGALGGSDVLKISRDSRSTILDGSGRHDDGWSFGSYSESGRKQSSLPFLSSAGISHVVILVTELK